MPTLRRVPRSAIRASVRNAPQRRRGTEEDVLVIDGERDWRAHARRHRERSRAGERLSFDGAAVAARPVQVAAVHGERRNGAYVGLEGAEAAARSRGADEIAPL